MADNAEDVALMDAYYVAELAGFRRGIEAAAKLIESTEYTSHFAAVFTAADREAARRIRALLPPPGSPT